MSIAEKQQTLETIYKDVLGEYRDDKELLWKHRGGFVHFIQSSIADELLHGNYSRKTFKLERLSYALEPARDRLLSERFIEDLRQKQLLRDSLGIPIETPQYYWMRRAMTDAIGLPNPTRVALKLYQKYSLGCLFNNQRLLFDVTRPVSEAGTTIVPKHFQQHGWIILDNVADEYEAIAQQARLINSNGEPNVQLAKADQIPVCSDIVATSFQVLHFDMGHPFVESKGQLFVSHVGIYLPKTTNHEVTASTRVVELSGLMRHLGLSGPEIEAKLMEYTRTFGDGWKGHNTLRLAAFVRFLDAMGNKPELGDQIDKTVGQWFGEEIVGEDEAYKLESEFLHRHGIDLMSVEHRIRLQPGQLLLLDNTRVIHGRMGKRRAKELFNFMWGRPEIAVDEISKVRKSICADIATKSP